LYLASSASSDTSENECLAVAGTATTKRKISKGDSEVFVFRISWNFVDYGFSYITCERVFNILYAIIYVLSGTLCEHFNVTIVQIADKAR
jgi:hypothetical protein